MPYTGHGWHQSSFIPSAPTPQPIPVTFIPPARTTTLTIPISTAVVVDGSSAFLSVRDDYELNCEGDNDACGRHEPEQHDPGDRAQR